jgi:hypothetical protein
MPEGDVQINGRKPISVGWCQRVPKKEKRDGPNHRPKNPHKITVFHDRIPPVEYFVSIDRTQTVQFCLKIPPGLEKY